MISMTAIPVHLKAMIDVAEDASNNSGASHVLCIDAPPGEPERLLALPSTDLLLTRPSGLRPLFQVHPGGRITGFSLISPGAS